MQLRINSPERLEKRYVGRFAPSPTGPLHLGSVVAALASWLDARAAKAQGWDSQWLVRIEDLDAQRCSPQAGEAILRQLQSLGLQADAPVQWQSCRTARYQHALQQLVASGQAYPCACTRKDIARAWQAKGVARARFETLIYPGTCRHAQGGVAPRVWRFAVPDCGPVQWHDRRLGDQVQDVARQVGDFALRRGDGMWSYQLGCVVDDGAQGVTHIVRGEDLVDNTPRQLLLQAALGLPPPTYLHVPLARDARGEKLSKGNHAPSVDGQDPVAVLHAAAQILELPLPKPASNAAPAAVLAQCVPLWAQRYPLR
ncbi:glutamyl-tRNA synthetase [Lampropedia cohaerens]|uniref:Glutamyl-Q tRNA(Asp) synthetase n=1 Tax=Lampropedia cohaerens TaxID=1610491 RepID=A0A0U1Q1I4_9BURK|nr:tRNA glutamyl-Q(34) synthetase GluQRS [Lampropedia cohaerens]KKW68617.1 glutamyl-tRNA synthetase [Lampropedia cohaerens]